MNTKTPLVSIILPAYNTERYLAESIDSVLRQSFPDFELIIINDGSTDNTQAIIDTYTTRDPRIVVIQQDNRGLVATLNSGIKKARGTYIARIDGDDPWFDNKLQAQVDELLCDPGLVLIGGGFEIVDENGYFIETILPPTRDEDIRRTLLLRNSFGHASVVFKKDAVIKAGLYDDKYKVTEDYNLWIKLSGLGRVKNLPYPIYRYRINMSGLSQQNSDKQMEETKQQQESLWHDTPPRLLTRRELLTQAIRYLRMTDTRGFGVSLKQQFLEDNAQIAVRYISHGNIVTGIRQLLSIASVGRSGLKAVIKRVNIYKLRRG